MRLRLLVATLALPLVLWGFLPVISSAKPSLSERIQTKRSAVEQRKGRERALAQKIRRYSGQIGGLQGNIDVLSARQANLQGDLNAKRAELSRIQVRLRAERARLTRLRARLAEARAALRSRLVGLYKSDRPDLMTVVLEADGFDDLLTRTEFMQRISKQDGRILTLVRTAKVDATGTAKRLDGLEARGQRVASAIEGRRDEVASNRSQLTSRRDTYASLRSARKDTLVSVRDKRHVLQEDLDGLEKEQSAIRAKLAAAAAAASASSAGGAGARSAGPIKQGSGALVYPVDAPMTSPFGFRWGKLHAGIDFGVPEGTPLRAADSGKVVLMAPTGGYGNYTCIQHTGSLSTCYAHQSRFGASLGASVTKGQIIGYSGNTGHSTGPHLHFETRVNGNPVNPLGYL